MKKILTLLLLLSSITLSAQTIYYVKPTGSDANNGTSWATAFKTLQKALLTASAGEIWVAAGTYYPDRIGSTNNNDRTATFNLKSNLALYGGFAGTETDRSQRNWKANVTILTGDIDGNNAYAGNSYHVLQAYFIENGVLDGFTVTWGNADGNPFEPDGYGRGGGLNNCSSTLTVANCRFLKNNATRGGGINNWASTLMVVNTSFLQNQGAAGWGGAIYNESYWGSLSGREAQVSATNCTFYGNSAADGGALDNSSFSTATLANCILWGNSCANGPNCQIHGEASVSYSIVQGDWNGEGNLDADPLFVNADAGNLHVQCNSPAIDAGDNAAIPPMVITDLDGLPRIGAIQVDMGAYELPSVLYVKADATGLNDGSSWANAFTTLQDALPKTMCNLPVQIWVAKGTYYPDEGAGLTNNDRTLSFALQNNVVIYGGFEGTEIDRFMRNPTRNETILSGDIDGLAGNSGNAYHVVTATSVDGTAVLDGFTITEGNATGTNENYGGGLYNTSASPTIANCTFSNNSAASGGALFNLASSPTLTRCSFLNNRANSGGAIYNRSTTPTPSNSSPVINGCSFFSNIATGDGGALYNDASSGTVVNCIFWSNSAATGAGLYNQYTNDLGIINCSFSSNSASSAGGALYNRNATSQPTVANCILWGDTKGEMAGDGATVTYSTVQGGGSGGIGNLTVDPLFYKAASGDLHLQPCSPAIDAGHEAAVPAGITTDRDGAPRTALTQTDMGAYEFQGALYVKKDATGLNNGSSWANAFTSLQDALAQPTGCPHLFMIWVARGTYYPDEGAGRINNDRSASFHLKNKMAILGGFAGTEKSLTERTPASARNNETILSGEIDGVTGNSGNSYHVVQAQRVNTTAVLDGFTITGGNADGTLYYLENCDIGGGLFIYDAAPTITNCIFRSNHAVYYGGAVGNMYTYGLVLSNCLFYDNSAKWGGAIAHYDYASSTVINCSFSGNTATGGGAIYSMNVSPQVTNSILWGNTGGQIESLHSPSVTYSIVQDGYYPGAGNLNADPLFVGADTGNLHLQACSPAIDAGNKEALTAATDLDGQPRTVVAQTDMGAYEFQGTVIYVKKEATGRANGTSWDNAYTSLQDALAQPTGCARLVTIWVAKGTYYPDEGAGLANNNRSLSFQLRNHTAILGGFAGTETSLSQRFPASARYYETILSGEIDGLTGNAGNSYHVVQSVGVDSSAFLESVTITGGNANGSTAPNNGGGGLYNTSTPTLRYCLFNANSATNGGAVYNTAAAQLVNCRFTQNKATYGGAIYNAGASPSVPNGLFWKNTATSQGGAIYNTAASPQIINGSFNSNTAPSGYGGALRNVLASAPTVTNSILWGDSGGEISNASSTPIVSYSIVQGGYSGGTNILNEDPKFADITTGQLKLTNFPVPSPAIDAGNNAAVTLTTDVNGDERIYNSIVDMGADEFYPGGIGGPDVLTLTCPQDFTLQSAPGSCGAVADYSGAHAATTTGGEPPVTLTYDPAPGTLLPLGDVLVTVTAKDALVTRTCSFWITVVDTVPPVITGVMASPSLLYPPNHQLQDIAVDYTVADSCAVAALSVSSNEAQYGAGSGGTGPDWKVIDNHHVQLRAERSGKGSDRVYTINITATDAAGNEAHTTTTVTVPHDKGAVTVHEAAGKEAGVLEVTAVPNPSAEGFALHMQSPSPLPLVIRVMDAAGRIVERRSGVAANGVQYLGSTYKPGVYYVQVEQGAVRQTLKVVKQAQ